MGVLAISLVLQKCRIIEIYDNIVDGEQKTQNLLFFCMFFIHSVLGLFKVCWHAGYVDYLV